MKFIDEIKRDMVLSEHEKQEEKNKEFDKQLYKSDLIQKLLDRVSELEDKLDKLERR